MHEILTLQFGNQSNYLGTHFWNTQESYFTYPPEPESPVNHDILFRQGIAPDGSDTFTPRTLIYDLKGAFGSMKKVNALYEHEDEVNVERSDVWPSRPIVQRLAPIQPSPYQTHLDAGLDPPLLNSSTVRYWSDYSRVFYHPKSLVQLSEFDVNDKLMPFEKWDVGMEFFEKLEREEDLVDRDLRPFIEECDGVQGIQIFTGVDDAWGGWASGWMERLRDEYGKLSIWTWGLGDQGGNMSISRDKRLQQIENASRSFQSIAEHSSVFVPMTNIPKILPSYLSIDPNLPWHIGALQCIALESMTMPSRLRTSDGQRGTLQDLEDAFNSTGKRRIAKLSVSIADPDVLSQKASSNIQRAEKAVSTGSRRASTSSELEETLSEYDMDLFTKDYRTGVGKPHKNEHVFGCAEALRGDWNLVDDRDPHDRFGDGPAIQRFSTGLLFPLLNSFPSSAFDFGTEPRDKLAVHTGLFTSTAVADQVRAVEQIVRRMHMVSIDEREALCNGLQTMAEEYDEGWDEGSDSDEDD